MKILRLLPVFAFFATAHIYAAQLTFLSEQNEPVNYEDHRHKAAGFSVELLKLMWQQMAVPSQTIKFMPWARAYYTAQTESGYVLFATSRTADRENMFKWVCPISVSAVSLFRRDNEHFDLKNNGHNPPLSIGVIRADIAEEVVITQINNQHRLIKARNIDQLVRLLQSKKVDMIAAYEPVVYTTMQQMGLNPADYPRELILQKMTDCFAFNRTTNDQVVDDYQKALNAVQKSPEYRSLIAHYHMLDFQ